MTSEEVHVSDQQALVIELMQALESGAHGEELRRFFHHDVEQVEYPSLVDPRVGRRGLDGMIAASELGAGMLAFQRYDVSRWIEEREHSCLPGRVARRAGQGRGGAASRAAASHVQRLDLHVPRREDHPAGGVRLLRAVLRSTLSRPILSIISVGVEVEGLRQPLAKLIIDLVRASQVDQVDHPVRRRAVTGRSARSVQLVGRDRGSTAPTVPAAGTRRSCDRS